MPQACQSLATAMANSQVGGVALVDDVSRLADHGLEPSCEHLGEQREMAAVVDLGEALCQTSGKFG